MATKRQSEPDNEEQQQQSDGLTSNKKVRHNSAHSNTTLDESKANDTNDTHTKDVISKRESTGEITQSGWIQLGNSEPDNGDQHQQSDCSATNANNTYDSNADGVLYKREAAVETTQSGTIQVRINETSSYKYIDTKRKFTSVINELNDKIKDDQTIAFDCEGVDLSRFGCLTMVNIGTRDMVYLIDVLKIGDSVFDDGLRSILENNTIEKLKFLSSDTLLRLIQQGREHMLKTTNTCNIWNDRPLSESMLKYAAVDVLALFKLYDKFKNRMTHKTWKAASSLYCNSKRSRTRTYRD